MFDPSHFVLGGRWGYIVRHERTDYHVPTPWRERLNPLRYEIGIGRHRPCAIIINKGGWMNRRVADFIWRLRKSA